MKKLFLLMAFMLFATIAVKATVHTVSNDVNQPARWPSLQMACDSAGVGDTIYVQGTATNYGDIHIKKRLHLIGAGIKPDGNFLYGYPTYVGSILLDTVNYISGASGSIIEGITLYGATNIITTTYIGCKNLIIRRNRIARHYSQTISITNSSNIFIVNNIVNYINCSSSTNILIFNNIFVSTISAANSSTIISNNVFINTTAFSACQSSTISNNIFFYGEIGDVNYSNFSNNMAFGISSNIVTGTNAGSNNFQADPQFLYLYSTTNHFYNDQNKYKLKSSSTGKNAGTDGSDVGIYGGQYPWPASVLTDFIHCIPPTIPMMEQLTIQNSSVPANGTLNFSVKAYKSSK